MEKPKLIHNRRYKQGIFTPQYPEKYVGNIHNIIFRSSWELSFFKWLDVNSNVLQWGSEPVTVEYISPLDGKIHKYFPDIVMIMKEENSITKFVVEIKPYAETRKPRISKKKKILNESDSYKMKTYLINMAKWDAAKIVCQRNGYKFIVLTEKDLFK